MRRGEGRGGRGLEGEGRRGGRDGSGRGGQGKGRRERKGKGRAPNNFSHPQFRFSTNMHVCIYFGCLSYTREPVTICVILTYCDLFIAKQSSARCLINRPEVCLVCWLGRTLYATVTR